MAESDRSQTGAEALVSTLADQGVTACFANPGTSEMHLVTALDREPKIHSVLCLFEGVTTGAADGFARVTGEPAMTLLHLGAGYMNAGANIHNAKRAWTPMINVIGDHAVPHQRYDAPLTSDIRGLAGPNHVWIKSADSVSTVGELAAEAWEASLAPVSGPAALLLPADTAWLEGAKPGKGRARPMKRAFDAGKVEKAARAIKAAKSPVIIINGSALVGDGLEQATRLKAAGVRIITDTFFGRQSRGAGRFAPERLAYFAEGAMADLEGVDLMIVAGSQLPVAFFAYPGKPSLLVPEGCATQIMCGPESDAGAALGALADELGAKAAAPVVELSLPDAPTGGLNGAAVAASIARHMPEGTFVSDDGVSNSLPSFMMTQAARPHDWMMLTGGAIGQGMPLALGASVAAPDNQVLCLSGDGAGMYTAQALWSMAREGANVVTVVFVNHSYRILNIELARTGAGNPGPTAKSLLELGQPEIDWVALSQSMGVPAVATATAEAFDAALEKAFAAEGPQLIAAHVPAR